MFTSGQADRQAGLEALAEDGDPSALAASLATNSEVIESGAFTTPAGASGPAPAFSRDSYQFTLSALPGDRLSLATMLVQTNDLFFAFGADGLALFDAQELPVGGDVTSSIQLWDAGTEVNQYPGAGPDQAPRQSAANTGADEGGVVMPVNDSHSYPAVVDFIRVTITPLP